MMMSGPSKMAQVYGNQGLSVSERIIHDEEQRLRHFATQRTADRERINAQGAEGWTQGSEPQFQQTGGSQSPQHGSAVSVGSQDSDYLGTHSPPRGATNPTYTQSASHLQTPDVASVKPSQRQEYDDGESKPLAAEEVEQTGNDQSQQWPGNGRDGPSNGRDEGESRNHNRSGPSNESTCSRPHQAAGVGSNPTATPYPAPAGSTAAREANQRGARTEQSSRGGQEGRGSGRRTHSHHHPPRESTEARYTLPDRDRSHASATDYRTHAE
jgi:hypothetical protein